MKIETVNPSFRSAEIQFSEGIKIKFDNKGMAEVEDTVAEKILKDYQGMVFREGEIEKEIAKNNAPKSVSESKEIEKLKRDLSLAEEYRDNYKKDLEVEKRTTNEWKSQYEKEAKKVNELKAQLATKGNAPAVDSKEVESLKKENEVLSLKFQLIQQNSKDLEKAATDSGVDPEKLKGANKLEMINLIIDVLHAQN